ncbi:TPA: TetR family transcriptional regulator C-terminal domain-containing protein [Burkholderia aenigmatica]|uniref:TetR/AcrR family transcriptional regulator n=1 Tax=Burkholderia sp. AU45251 TaxID=3059204 RepID=UPI002653B3D5|nr:TetR/AcrR family transcriptional regulator [Burkholderia sp. AU45251]HDR9483256.1 TetR family transcriptional regulator C-terminal domain-containing protein [Burkholderia aenigmatica]MDN7516121.1 TetR/AcrR family transcriptional regulator [Burkholderia sp. AU45251]HDR9514204.1 TetR family transcriptional regulator C-terminal domain-containing protein [Burkholderia aenigmatica]HDR9591594.1 TetR family transcriptional regulator C-terminal domain-containing protein [Burkholderia aenigmatica]HD
MRHDEAATEATDSDETPAPLRRRKAHIRESNEAHLLACAEAVFAERGLDGASTAMIAERAGLPKANLHYYFPTKLALYRRVLDDLFEDWHRAAGTFEADDDPVEAIGAYVRAKMALSRRRPLGSKVWANEIIHGAEHMQDILSERVKPWFDTRVKVIDGWIARGLLAPIDAHALMYLIWATTQHYADFDAQIRALSGKRTFTQKAFDEKTEKVVQLVIRACGAVSPRAKT